MKESAYRQDLVSVHREGCWLRWNEIALLSLQETYCLCVLVYAIPALSLTTKQIE